MVWGAGYMFGSMEEASETLVGIDEVNGALV